jgi:hypothetical protein
MIFGDGRERLLDRVHPEDAPGRDTASATIGCRGRHRPSEPIHVVRR